MVCVRPLRMHFPAKATHNPSLPQARHPYLFPCLIPVCGLIPGITLVVRMTELSKPKEDL